MSSDLDPLDPESGLELYLDQRRGEVSEQTLESHRYRLEPFVEWCDDRQIYDLNDLSGRDLHSFRVFRREEGDLKPVTLQGQLSTLRVFINFCESIDAAHSGLHEKILLPSLSESEQISKTLLEPDRAERILSHLEKYRYASLSHVLLTLLWKTGVRMGSARAIDLDDYDPDGPAVRLCHRPEGDTPLKNKLNAERWVALRAYTANLIEEYSDGPRIDTQDEFGRDPLLTTSHGRISRSSVRNTVYRTTRPCEYGGCPHDRDPAECEATDSQKASACPSSRSPHEIRSGAITAHLLDDVPPEAVSDRMDVSPEILDRHYDRRSERDKMEQRRNYLEG